MALVDAPGRRPPAAQVLPGGVVGHGEHPRDAAVRACTALGVAPVVTALHGVVVGVEVHPGPGLTVHTLRVVYAARPAAVTAGPDAVGVRWAAPDGLRPDEPAPWAARVLGLADGDPAEEVLPGGGQDLGAVLGTGGAPPGDEAPRVQRAGAYAVCVQDVAVDGGPPVPSVLLARYVGNGRWTLPGGGIDPGEQPEVAVRREVHEEAGLPLTWARLLDVDSLRFTGRAPDGRREDFHAVRVVYAGTVPTDVAPRVTEVGGTTDAVGWVPLADLGRHHVSALVTTALRHVL